MERSPEGIFRSGETLYWLSVKIGGLHENRFSKQSRSGRGEVGPASQGRRGRGKRLGRTAKFTLTGGGDYNSEKRRGEREKKVSRKITL